MLTREENQEVILTFSPEEKKILLVFYSEFTALSIAIKKVVQEWVDARVKLDEETSMRNLVLKFKNLSTDDKNKVLNIMEKNNGNQH